MDERRDGSSIVAGSVYVSRSKDVGCFNHPLAFWDLPFQTKGHSK